MRNITVTSKGVEKILKSVNASKAMGPERKHPRVLKELAPNISEVMAHFFQQSINRRTIPDKWKNANIHVHMYAHYLRRTTEPSQVITDQYL